jgi:uncharacterized protein involved in exopolysaccharide biosynthesis
MKRILKFLVRLYPSDWRKRYGVEYEALLDEGTPRARDASDVLWQALKMQTTNWRFVKIVLPSAVCAALVAVAISFAVPPQYVSQTVILVTTGYGVAGPEGNTVASAADASPRGLDGAFLDDASLASIVQELDLYPRERARMSQEDLIKQMRRGIDIRPVMKGLDQSAFAVQFRYPDPHVAQQVDRQLVSTLMMLQLRARMNRSSTTPSGYETFRVYHDASLPLAPSSPKRGIFGASGLLAGIAGGLMLAAAIRRYRETAAAR